MLSDKILFNKGGIARHKFYRAVKLQLFFGDKWYNKTRLNRPINRKLIISLA